MKKLFIILLLVISLSLVGCGSDEKQLTLLGWCFEDIKENYGADANLFILDSKEIYIPSKETFEDFPNRKTFYITVVDDNGYKSEYVSIIYYHRGGFDHMFKTASYTASQIGVIDSDIVIDKEEELLEEEQEEVPIKQPYEIMYGNFVGFNYYDYEIPKTYVVILIDEKEHETIGYKNNSWVMNERVIVLKINDEYYSIPLREVEQ